MQLKLDEVVMLGCQFQLAPSENPEPQDEVRDDPNLLKLRTWLSDDPDGVTLFIEAVLDDDRLDFTLELDLGARFICPTKERPETDELRSTLVFMAFPYLRQMVADITQRSPVSTFYLDALALPPKPDDEPT